ncbi:MAG: hypothetical protein PWP22_1209, partial [Thermoanaerobacter sp.]|nr:hypothetical protein [Thermoanaerobacter sp.]
TVAILNAVDIYKKPSVAIATEGFL